jgi:hypothetical protein
MIGVAFIAFLCDRITGHAVLGLMSTRLRRAAGWIEAWSIFQPESDPFGFGGDERGETR